MDEALVERPIDVDEDAAAFLREAAEAAVAAEFARHVDSADPAAEHTEAAQASSRAAADEALLEAEAVTAEMEADGADSLEATELQAADEALLEAEALAAEMEADGADSMEATELQAADEALLEAEALAAEMEAADAASAFSASTYDSTADGGFAGPDSIVREDPLSSNDDEEATLRADLEWSEGSQTAEEQALAQAEDEQDPDADVVPADIAELEEELQGSFDRIAAKSKRLSEDQVRHVIHSILFVADKPLGIEQIRNATGLENARIRTGLERLAGDLREGISGIILSEVAGGWQLRTAPESSDYVRRFLQVKPRRLTRAALETLAIIAYRQPVTRPEIEDIRGVDSGAVVKALLDWKLLKILGKKDEVGRPLLYGTSREFLEFFQLKDLASLPTLREFHELTEESQQIVEEELGPEAAIEISGTVAELADPAYLEEERLRIAKSEAALADLEQALADAELKATAVAHTINPPKDPEATPSEPPAEES